MFGCRTLWESGRHISTSRFPKDMHIFRAPGSWNWQNRKLKEHLPWGRSEHNEVCTGGIHLYQSTTFLYLAESDGWVQQQEVSLPKHHIWIFGAFRNLGATHSSKYVRYTLFETCSVRGFTTPVIQSNPDPINCLAQLLSLKQEPGIQS